MHSGNDCRLQTPQMVSLAAANLFMITARDGKTIFNSIAVYTSPQMKCYNCTTGPLNQTETAEALSLKLQLTTNAILCVLNRRGGSASSNWTTGEKYQDCL